MRDRCARRKTINFDARINYRGVKSISIRRRDVQSLFRSRLATESPRRCRKSFEVDLGFSTRVDSEIDPRPLLAPFRRSTPRRARATILFRRRNTKQKKTSHLLVAHCPRDNLVKVTNRSPLFGARRLYMPDAEESRAVPFVIINSSYPRESLPSLPP